jgi:hypothetical protein
MNTVKFKCPQLNSYTFVKDNKYYHNGRTSVNVFTARLQHGTAQHRTAQHSTAQHSTLTWYHPDYSNRRSKIFPNLAWNWIGSFQKTSIPPPQKKLDVNPPTPFGCPNTAFTIIRNNFISPTPPDGRNFLCGGVWIFYGNNNFIWN